MGLLKDPLRGRARGITLRFDGAQAKLFIDSALCSRTEIMVTRLSAYSEDGGKFDMAPYLNRPIQRDAMGLLWAINFEQILSEFMPLLCEDKEKLRFCLFACDSASANLRCIRHAIAELRKFGNLIVTFHPCLAHNLSNVAMCPS